MSSQQIQQKLLAIIQIIALTFISPFIWLYYSIDFTIDFAVTTFNGYIFESWCIWEGVAVEDEDDDQSTKK
jgi:hypothetical protein